ncbi:hypothetical protein TBLA_0F00480 [Henningerozyma blattae CBS 6284]|uniref:Type 2A phosphatase activator TIP41 n=1 Tax=Henningerozyma blattae (strain ATCC 34711 / CBS 6284 / DSM 70876 / NBRC 10599 / NRRL Y-10934 / UCD 77-7) TaxID=1071380 RepID=I2H5E0_HENB6|nr:hypothetical protein TBLA_0F00480 [Tetrapisispora blattae CBS 6284]CCH61592.1 hypothetical protein TBLA_0F00480 [Tetrapisispora blattae CBS 6284]
MNGNSKYEDRSNENKQDGKNTPSTTTSVFKSPASITNPGVLRGLRTIQINSAREIHARTVAARHPAMNRRPITTTSLKGDSVNDTHISSTTTTETINISTTTTIPKPRHICNNPNNPLCAHCGATIIPSPQATLPLADNPSVTIDDWVVSTMKKPILKTQEFEDWENNKLKGLSLPEMIFGNSYVRIKNTKYNWSLEFNTLDALSRVNLKDSGIRVSYSNKWIKSKQAKKTQLPDDLVSTSYDNQSLKIVNHYDWTYTTDYKGTETPTNQLQRDDAVKLPIDKLSRHDPIIFFDDMILFEDELADNGISVFNIKIRVMNERLLILARFFLRVDDVLLRIRDTRVYVEFNENKVIREYKEYEGNYNETIAKSKSTLQYSRDPKAALRDNEWVVRNIPLVNRESEILILQ